MSSAYEKWPALPLSEWKDTYDTLHMWTQIVGKIRMELSPPVNHWWHTTLYVTSTGMTTSPIPCDARTFEIRFDLIRHNLLIEVSDGSVKALPLMHRTVADFYGELVAALRSLGIECRIWTMPQEFPDPIRFELDDRHAAYDPEYANRFFRVLSASAEVMQEFRGRFIGKSSPVHFFWGSFDLAVTRFSGRRAPKREGADPVTAEAYSHEVISAGFWPGSGEINDAAYYAYAAPEPTGFAEQKVIPAQAFYSPTMKEYFLMYEDVRRSRRPEKALMEFLQSTYEAGANAAKWDREALERPSEVVIAKAG